MEPHWNLKTPLRSRKSAPQCGFSDIGAPGFEPGTSPTRTARATRLRHAPTHSAVSHTAIVARVPTQIAEILAELDALLEPARFQDYCAQRPAGPGTAADRDARYGRVGERGAVRARGERARRICCSSTTACSGARARGADRRTAQAPPAAAVRRRHRARRLPPAARRAPTLGNNALIADALGARAARRSVRAAPRRADRLPGALPRRGPVRRGAVRARARPTEREPLVFDSRAVACSHAGDRVGRPASDYLPRHRGGRRRVAHRRARRARDGASARARRASHRRRPLRDRDIRRARARRASSRAVWRASRIPGRTQPGVGRAGRM